MGMNSTARINPNFWRGKRVLVTGHTGFKGSWLCLWLESLNAEAFGLALPPLKSPALFHEARVSESTISILGDIRDYETVQRAMQQAQPEIVIHMAAQPLVRYSYQEPIETYATNVMGTAHVLEVARKVGTVRAVINVTTDKCYENKEWIWGYRENEPMGGHDPYSSSKACSELVTNAYRRSFYESAGIALASARAGNVIGGGDWAEDRLVPDILRAFEKKQPVVIRYPHAIRPWQHVLEPLSGYLQLAEKLHQNGNAYSGAWNFGPNDHDAKPVEWIVEQMTRKWGADATWTQDDGDRPHEADYLKLDISKAKCHLGWQPSLNLDQALGMIVDWHKAWRAGADMYKHTKQQVKNFVGKTT
jgi:CDP-glucose 4,6-dehydratase